jgi:hypothetical protein
MGKVTKCLVWENFEKLGSMCVVNGVRGGERGIGSLNFCFAEFWWKENKSQDLSWSLHA